MGNFVETRLQFLHILSDISCKPEFYKTQLELEEKTNRIRAKYYDDIEKLSDKENFIACLNEFYVLTNAFRNSVTKEIKLVENKYLESLRTSHLYKSNKEFKGLITHDYIAAKKVFVDQDSYLKKKVGEIVREREK